MSTNPARAVLGEVVSRCRHGSPLLDQDLTAAVLGFVGGTQLGGSPAELFHPETLEQFWSQPKHARLIDAKMVRFCVALATVTALGENMQASRVVAILGIYLAAWFKLGKDAFLEALNSECLESLESSNIQPMLDFQASLGKMGTDRELVLFLAKQIPCSCLDEDKKKAKQAPKTGCCIYCNCEVLKLELKTCSQCKMFKYCSKECQVADWRTTHKKECIGYKQLFEQNAALKAQTR
jgi:hypothetical protein